MNNQNTLTALSYAIHNSYQFLLNNDIDNFVLSFNQINTEINSSKSDNLLLLKLIDDVNNLLALVELKNEEISNQIKKTRKHLLAHHTYQSK